MPSDSHALKPAPVADASNSATPRLTPGQREHRRTVGAMLSRAITSGRSSQRLVAEALGVSRARLAAYVDGEAPFPTDRILDLPAKVRGSFVDQLAATSTLVVGLPLFRHVATLSAELGDVARVTLEQGDAETLERELTDLLRATQAALATVRASSK